MAEFKKGTQLGESPAAADDEVDSKLAQLAEANIEGLRTIWRERQCVEVPAALTKDLMARALAHAIQEDAYGGLDPRLRKLLNGFLSGADPGRHVKVGSIIVREYEGVVHEVMVVPGGFCWQGQVFASLSTIAKRITGTSWNGPRFFGLRGREVLVATRGVAQSLAQKAQVEKAAIDRGRVRIAGVKRRPTLAGRES